MGKTIRNSRTRTVNFITYALVIIAYIILQSMVSSGNIKSVLKGMLVPICAYIVMAVSLNLTVGVLGELSLGHAGFMSVGAFTGVTAAMAMFYGIPGVAPWLRLLVGMVTASHRHSGAPAEGGLSCHRHPCIRRDYQISDQ